MFESEACHNSIFSLAQQKCKYISLNRSTHLGLVLGDKRFLPLQQPSTLGVWIACYIVEFAVQSVKYASSFAWAYPFPFDGEAHPGQGRGIHE